MIRLPLVLFLSAALFSTGVYGVLARRNGVLVLMSIELMLNAVNINLVAFGAALHDLTGQVFALFVITVAAAEVGIGLAIVILIYRNRVETETDILVGKREDLLRRVDGAWRIARRKIILDQSVLLVKNLTFFF